MCFALEDSFSDLQAKALLDRVAARLNVDTSIFSKQNTPTQRDSLGDHEPDLSAALARIEDEEVRTRIEHLLVSLETSRT